MRKASIVVRYVVYETGEELMSVKLSHMPVFPKGTVVHLKQKAHGYYWEVKNVDSKWVVHSFEVHVSKIYPDTNNIDGIHEFIDTFCYLEKPEN